MPDNISLRDWFAGQALAGLMASNPHTKVVTEEATRVGYAAVAYMMADAMLIAREAEVG